MSWAALHGQSEELAAKAEAVRLRGDVAAAVPLYRQAAEQETLALEALDRSKERTLGITAVSAVALWYRSGEYETALQLAHRLLGSGTMPRFAKLQLRDLLHTVWTTQAQEAIGIRFVPGDVLVSVKGGRVVYGGAPLDLILRKVEEVQSMFFRTAEWLLKVPHRKSGAPSAEVRQVFQPWLFQAPAGSYQFAVRVQEPDQTDLFPDAQLRVPEVVSTFLSILKTGVMDPDGSFKDLVADEEYQSTFLKLTRNLAPTGTGFEQIEFRDPTALIAEPVALSPIARKDLNASLKERRRASQPPQEIEMELRGVLRALHLDQHWLEVLPDCGGPGIKIHETADVLEDVVGPMVNREVVVDVVTDSRGRHIYRDIQPAE